MRHKNWKTYLKIACSWLLIFSICFMNLETVSASEDETSVVTEQEETENIFENSMFLASNLFYLFYESGNRKCIRR